MPRKLDRRALQETALHHFIEVAQAGSVTAAAERLHVAPSAVSRSIARLEDALDTLLFERRARGMRLNAAGELLAAHARRAWHDIEQVASQIESLRGNRTGTVRVASTEGLASEFLPMLIAEFQRSHPGVRFMLEIAHQADVPDLLRPGDMDVGFTFGTRSQRHIQVVVRRAAPILAGMAPSHPMAGRLHLTLAELVGHPLVLPPGTSTLRQLFDISCARQGLTVDPVPRHQPARSDPQLRNGRWRHRPVR